MFRMWCDCWLLGWCFGDGRSWCDARPHVRACLDLLRSMEIYLAHKSISKVKTDDFIRHVLILSSRTCSRGYVFYGCSPNCAFWGFSIKERWNASPHRSFWRINFWSATREWSVGRCGREGGGSVEHDLFDTDCKWHAQKPRAFGVPPTLHHHHRHHKYTGNM